jgi:hypothetical protein
VATLLSSSSQAPLLACRLLLPSPASWSPTSPVASVPVLLHQHSGTHPPTSSQRPSFPPPSAALPPPTPCLYHLLLSPSHRPTPRFTLTPRSRIAPHRIASLRLSTGFAPSPRASPQPSRSCWTCLQPPSRRAKTKAPHAARLDPEPLHRSPSALLPHPLPNMSGTALPRPARSSIAPPTGPLPSLPVSKQRPSNIGSPSLRAPSASLANPTTRAVSSPYRPGPKYAVSSTPSSPPTEHPPPTPLSAGKSLRKAVSIGAFPQPPRHATRNPSSPLSTSSSALDDSVDQRLSSSSITSAKSTKSAPLARNSSLQKPRASNVGGARGLLPKSPLSPPSFLNGSAESSTVDTSHLSLPSPPQSRNSSPQGSYTTSATTCEDGEDETRGRSEDRNSVAKDGKGNVIVSVRVRPDVGAKDSTQEMDWEVNNKRALISYRGREGGEYIYGKLARR